MTKHKGVCFMLRLLCSLLYLGGEKRQELIKFKRKNVALVGTMHKDVALTNNSNKGVYHSASCYVGQSVTMVKSLDWLNFTLMAKFHLESP